MERTRGIKLVKLFKWIAIKPRMKPSRYDNLAYLRSSRSPMAKLRRLAKSLKRGAKELCSPKSDPRSMRLGQDPFKIKHVKVPKGHLAVYVGGYNDEAHRVMVPVMYFNHPLFSDLLKEAEMVYGYNHPGGIIIPCEVSEFEKVQNKIAERVHSKTQRWRRW